MLRQQLFPSTLNVGVSLFDISSTQSSPKKIAWQTSDGQESTDISEIILGVNTESVVLEEAKSSLQRNPEVPSSSNLVIDGHFDDWKFIEKYQDSDWNEYQKSPSVTENPNVDIERYKGVSDDLNSFFYLKVYGEMLGGSIVPMASAKQIPVDSYTPGNGLNTVTPITGSSNLPEKNGEDTIYIFLDTNTSEYFGFEVNDTFHADNLIEIIGQNGLIKSAKLYNFVGNDSSDWSWQFEENVLAASFGNELELSIPKIEDTFKAYYHLISWDNSEDFSNGFWVVEQFGSKTTPAWTEHTIKGNYDAAWDVYAIDLDRDGDMDVLGAAAGTSQDISWWENDGTESFTKRTISSSYPGANSVFALDFDKDGDIDVLSTGAASSGDDVTWWENDGTPSNGGWDQHTIDPDLEEAWYVRAADIDEDGDIDVVAAGKGAGGTTGKIKWYINDGSPNDDDWTAVQIDNNIYDAMCVRIVDIDLDGDLDVLGAAAGSSDLIAWWENDGTLSGAGWTQNNIQTSYKEAHSVFAADIDGDGDIDVVGTSGGEGTDTDRIDWFENDGSQSFTKRTIDSTYGNAWGVYVKDLDYDGDLDVLSSASGADDVTWWENDGSPSDGGWTEHTIEGNFDGARHVYAEDVDSDGDIDVLAVANIGDDITWWENTANFVLNPTWTSRDINTAANGAEAVHVGDIDGDGDLDVVAALYNDNQVAWYENDGTPSDGGWTHHIVKDYSGNGIEDLFVADIDDDGDLDIISADGSGDKILYHINDGTPGNGAWTTNTVISGSDADGAMSVHVADIDSDGDLDIVAALFMTSHVVWIENDGSPNNGGWTSHDVVSSSSSKESYDVTVADIDGDGDLDILEADQTNKIYWYENDGTPDDGTWSMTKIKGGLTDAHVVATADLDNDGDIDVISGAYTANKVSWHLNDGTPGDAVWTTYEIGTPTKPTSLFPVDIDYDGDIDIITSTDQSSGKVRLALNDGTPDAGWTWSNIASSINRVSSVFVGDIDGDGNLDVVSAAYAGDEISWHENSGAAIPEFSNILMPIVSVLSIIGLNRMRRYQ